MLNTSELRWFIRGSVPDEFSGWFSAGRPPALELREDHEYLLFPACDSVGVKARGGKFEIKARAGSSRVLPLPFRIGGRSEDWVKWSLSAEELPQFDRVLHKSGEWMRIAKDRLLYRFAGQGDGPFEISAGENGPPPSGYSVELTKIEVEREPHSWFTFGFEAFGPRPDTTGILREAVHDFFGKHGCPPGKLLTRKNSLSYPAWLMMNYSDR